MKYKSFRDMPVWIQAMSLSVEVYHLSAGLPRSEDYGLTSQVRRAAGSVHANIAEGFGRKTPLDKSRFNYIAKGSCTETQSHLIYGVNVKYFDKEVTESLINQDQELIHNLNKLLKALQSSTSASTSI